MSLNNSQINNKTLPRLPLDKSPLLSTKDAEQGGAKTQHRNPRLPSKDVYLSLAMLLCFILSLLTVFYTPLAICLGQINQLVLIGFLVAVMGMCLEGQILRTALMACGKRQGTTLQDLDALMRKDPFADHVDWVYRVLLLIIFGLPLLLSVGYKQFIGGSSTILVHEGPGFFGFAAPPGMQRIGDGLSLLSQVYVPFWTDPGLNRTYGFNLFIAGDNKTAAMVDSPFPSYLTDVQSRLKNGETLTMSTTVNATVSEINEISDEDRNNETFWSDVAEQFGHEYTINGGNVRGANNALWAGMSGNFLTNFTTMYFSAWNTTSNETFESEAIRTEQTRRIANVTWVISPSNITLTGAKLIKTGTVVNQTVIQNNAIGLQEAFSNFLGEYDWHNRAGAFDYPYPISSDSDPVFAQPVNTVPALAAAMAWARISSLNTIVRPQGIQNAEIRTLTGYDKDEADIVTIKTVPTLRRHPLLILLLAVNPLLSFICVAIKGCMLHTSPVRDGFSSISLLAASRDAGFISFKDAANLTARPKRPVAVNFAIEKG
ncbi:uncharacterized protein Z519_06273 [Cladophialophora bantiana CBS 173.52]|uniref:Uncharacterized protein n=1 Tax=Cladophialophora bantiana (strain ATCC 10958 / CBS 173.52 / CDC B-1940 / NIH 8579) TaxID=1442370 RepID=A0A0D2HK60_CLAB1|nr:uncharacterized protein Z519_06273 [Cladophialophora bantiana CBS 173.52]KIW93668.1 hypothetical protein Z519_06273 [Cladophialophora bantiana CBS 173.52]